MAPVDLDPVGVAQAEDLQGSECASFSQTARNTLQPADVIWVVDNGGSIQGDIQFIRDNLDEFSQQIVDSGVDARIVLISDALDPDVVSMATPLGGPSGDWRSICIDAPLGSGSCPDDSVPPGFLHVDQNVGRGQPTAPTPERTALNMLLTTFPEYRSVLRPEATKTFVVVTDVDADYAPNDSAAAFTANVAATDPQLFAEWKMSGIVAFDVCPANDISSVFFPSVRGQVYLDLIMQSGGVAGDLCKMDFAPVFDDIAQGVIGASDLDCEWAIPEVPQGETFNPDEVNVVLRSSAGEQAFGNVPDTAECLNVDNAWYYDAADAPTKLLACPQTCDFIRSVPGATLDILFGCDTIAAGPD